MSIAYLNHGKRAFGYSAHRSKKTCANHATIQENKVIKMLGDLLKATLEALQGPKGALAGFMEAERKARRTPNQPAVDDGLDKAVAKAESAARASLAKPSSATGSQTR